MKINLLPFAVLFSTIGLCSEAQTPCPGSESCTGVVAQMVCPTPGTTLSGNDVTFTWCNANADYFLDIESILGAHDIFYGLVPAQNFVHLLNLPTNGVTIYVSLQTQVHGQWQAAQTYTYAATNLLPLILSAPTLGSDGQFRFTLTGTTPGRTNVIQASVDLLNWTPVSTNVATSNNLQITNPAPADLPQRFYRALEIH